MMALGVRYYDNTGALLSGCGASLNKIHHIDISKLHPAMGEASFTIFCDVDNPLHGPRGAAYVFGPQKGATPAMVEELDRGLRHYETVLQRYGYTNTDFAGVGAGGGFPLSLAAFSHAVIRSGISFIMEFVGLERHLRNADVVITGEGKLDEQTLSGKVVHGVASLTTRFAKPLVVVAGSSTLDNAGIRSLGVRHIITLVDHQTPVTEAILHARDLIRARVQENYFNIPGTQ
jgi:glycerate kinase